MIEEEILFELRAIRALVERLVPQPQPEPGMNSPLNWLYVTAYHPDLGAIAQSGADIAIVDYLKADHVPYTSEDVPDFPLVARLSVADAYDFIPEDAPAPMWVHEVGHNVFPIMGHPAWERAMRGAIDAIVDAGFAGVCFSDLDAYKHQESKITAVEVIDLVSKLAVYAIERNPDMLLMIDGGHELLLSSAFPSGFHGVVVHDILRHLDDPSREPEVLALARVGNVVAVERAVSDQDADVLRAIAQKNGFHLVLT